MSMTPPADSIQGLFSELFGDGGGIFLENGKWTFTPAPNFPKIQGEGMLDYLIRLASNCIKMRGVWEDGETYEKGDLVAFSGICWIATQTTTLPPSVDPNSGWELLFNSLTGLQGDPGKDGEQPFAQT